MTVGALLAKWNWKAALLSATIRGTIFFTTNLAAGLAAAQRAVTVDALFRIPLAGCYAAIIQSAATASGAFPAWIAVLIVPVVSHAIEFAVHSAAGTPAVHTSVALSAAFSVASSAFEWFAMRRGALIVGSEAASLRSDMQRLPRLVASFLAAPVVALRASLRAQ